MYNTQAPSTSPRRETGRVQLVVLLAAARNPHLGADE